MSMNYIVIPLRNLLSSEVYSEDVLLREFKKFKCTREPDLEHFLIQKAIKKEQAGVSRTYLFVNRQTLRVDNLEVMGFISLAVRSLNIKHLSQKQRKKVLGSSVENKEKLESISVFLIGQLGRSDAYTSKDLPGNFLLYEAFTIFKTVLNAVAMTDLVILECRPHMYDNFYKHHKFQELPLRDDIDLLTLRLRLSKITFEEHSSVDQAEETPA